MYWWAFIAIYLPEQEGGIEIVISILLFRWVYFDIGYLLGAVFTDVMQKPVDLDGLLRIVRYAWEKRQRWEKILMS